MRRAASSLQRLAWQYGPNPVNQAAEALPAAMGTWQGSTDDQASVHQAPPRRVLVPDHTAHGGTLGTATWQSTRGMAFWSRSRAPAPQTPQVEVDMSDPPGAVSEPTQSTSIANGVKHIEIVGVEPPSTSGAGPATVVVVDAMGPDAADAIAAACQSLEVTALEAAVEQSFLLGGPLVTAIQSLHDQYGLPWWGAIAIVNLFTRLATFPMLLVSQVNTSRMLSLNLKLLPVQKLQQAIARATTQEEKVHIHSAWVERVQAVQAEAGPQVPRMMLAMFGSMIVNTCVFLSIFNGVNNLVLNQAPSLTYGGALWFTDLTLPDPYYGLPVLCSLTTLAMIQYGMNVTGEQMATPGKAEATARIKNIFRFMALLFIPFGHYVPSGIGVLWASNSLFSVFAGVLLRQDGVRSSLGLPTLKETRELGAKLQALQDADPMSFVPPMPATTAPAPAAATAGGGVGGGGGLPPPPAPASPSTPPPPSA